MHDEGRARAKENMRNAAKIRRDSRSRAGIDNRPSTHVDNFLDVRVIEEKPDYLICVFLDFLDERPTTLTEVTDTTSANREIVNVAKPIELRRSYLAGEARPNKDDEILEYSYNDANGTDRTVELDPGGGDPVILEDHVVNPPYLSEVTIDSVIFAGSYITLKPIRNGTGVVDDAGNLLLFVDDEAAGRAWAEKDTS